MDSNQSIQKLMNKANVSYDDAKVALETCNGDMLDAIVFLEQNGKTRKPKTSVFYSNEVKANYEIIEVKPNNNGRYRKREGFFEVICEIIDKGNNIFFQIINHNKVLISLPLTAMILLIIFAFWIVVPIAIILLFNGFEFSVVGQNIEQGKVNSILKELSKIIKRMRKDSKQ